MARANCSQCGSDFRWYGGRGMKLADVLSPCCGAPAKGKTAGMKRQQQVGFMIELRERRAGSHAWEKQWNEPRRWKLAYRDGKIVMMTWTKKLIATETVVNGYRMLVDERAGYPVAWWDVYLIKESDWMKLQLSAA